MQLPLEVKPPPSDLFLHQTTLDLLLRPATLLIPPYSTLPSETLVPEHLVPTIFFRSSSTSWYDTTNLNFVRTYCSFNVSGLTLYFEDKDLS